MKMGTQYEKGTNGRWRILWLCKTTGAVIEEMELGNV
jgi:hypothetical protein